MVSQIAAQDEGHPCEAAMWMGFERQTLVAEAIALRPLVVEEEK